MIADFKYGVPLLDEFETGPWPSFVNPGPIMKTHAPEDHDQGESDDGQSGD